MNTLILAPRTDNGSVVRVQPYGIYVDGRRRRDLELLRWEILPAPDFGRASLALAERVSAGPCQRLGDPSRLPHVGAKVQVRPPSTSGDSEFIGSIDGHNVVIDEHGEQFVAECRHQMATDLAGRISILWQFDGQSAIQVKQAKIVFNGDRNALATDSAVLLNGKLCRVFDSGSSARPWSVADALGYLVAAAVPSNVEVPTMGELDALAGRIDLGCVDVTGKTACEALSEVAHRGGLELRSSRQGLGLIFYRPGKQGRRRRVGLQPVGSALDRRKSNLWAGQIRIHRRPARNGVLVLGQRKQYESTFDLAKGWDTASETGRWRDFVRSKSDNWPTLADVYRKWVLNEHGWYSQSPWNLPVHSFADISSSSFLVPCARSFLPCLSTDRQGESLGVVVETKCGSGAPWRRWRGPLWISRDECAIYLGGDGLPGEYFQSAAGNEAQVRVTCTVEADERLVAVVDGDTNAPCNVLDMSGRAAWKKVHSSSIFKDAAGVGTPAEEDDSSLLNELAQRQAEVLSTAVEADLTLGSVDTTFHVGDIVERIEGREFELSSNPDSRPFVRSVRHEIGSEQTTHLLLLG